jgi:hypothetical protein
MQVIQTVSEDKGWIYPKIGLNWSFNDFLLQQQKIRELFGHLYSHKKFKELHAN